MHQMSSSNSFDAALRLLILAFFFVVSSTLNPKASYADISPIGTLILSYGEFFALNFFKSNSFSPVMCALIASTWKSVKYAI